MSTLKTHTRRNVRRIRDTVADMNYAQRRAVEIKLGIRPDEYGSTERQEIEELEALFELEAVTPETEYLA